MNDAYKGLGLRRLIRIVNVAIGSDVRAICSVNDRLCQIFDENAVDGRLNRATFGLHHYPDLMPHLALITIEPRPRSDKHPLTSDKLHLRFMGSALDHIYGAVTGTLLSDYDNTDLVDAITISINHLRGLKTLISGGTLFDSSRGPLLLQTTFLPFALQGEPVDQVLAYISRKPVKMDA